MSTTTPIETTYRHTGSAVGTTLSEQAAWKGCEIAMEIERGRFTVNMVVVGVAMQYGRVRLRVRPVMGEGEGWVEAGRCKFLRRIDNG